MTDRNLSEALVPLEDMVLHDPKTRTFLIKLRHWVSEDHYELVVWNIDMHSVNTRIQQFHLHKDLDYLLSQLDHVAGNASLTRAKEMLMQTIAGRDYIETINNTCPRLLASDLEVNFSNHEEFQEMIECIRYVLPLLPEEKENLRSVETTLTEQLRMFWDYYGLDQRGDDFSFRVQLSELATHGDLRINYPDTAITHAFDRNFYLPDLDTGKTFREEVADYWLAIMVLRFLRVESIERPLDVWPGYLKGLESKVHDWVTVECKLASDRSMN